MEESLLALVSTWPFGAFVLLIGLCIGSFLNVCIYRLPAGKSIVTPGSHCMACGTPIAWYDNIPVLSYFVLRGRCRKCGVGFSARYMLVELITGLVWFGYWLAYFKLGVRTVELASGDIVQPSPGVYLVHMILASALLASAVIDFDRKEIYTAVTNLALGAGLVGSMLWPRLQEIGTFDHALSDLTRWPPTDALIQSLIGAAVGAGVINVTRFLGTLVFRKEAMGGGDVYLMAAIGGVLGWEAAVLVFFLAPFIGLPLGIWQVVRARRQAAPAKEEEQGEPPGPVLHYGTFLTTVLGFGLLVAAEAMAVQEWGPGARTMLLGSLLAFGASVFFLRREEEPPSAEEAAAPAPADSHEIPYGPSLGAAAGVVMLFQDTAMRWFGPGFENLWRMLVG